MIKSWQTTVAGLGCIAGGIYLIAVRPTADTVVTGAGLIAAGTGLLRARDVNVSSTSAEVAAADVKAEDKATEKALRAANSQ